MMKNTYFMFSEDKKHYNRVTEKESRKRKN